MNTAYRLLTTLMLVGVVCAPVGLSGQSKDDAAKDHARKIMDLLKQEKFEDVAKEFNGQMTAAMSAQKLGDAWSMVRGQAGDFKSIIDQQVLVQAGFTVVISGCEFAKGNLNSIIAFDADDKIGGLRFVPRT